MDPRTVDALARWMDIRPRSRALFCTLEGRPVLSGYVRDMLKRKAARAGIEKRVHPHGLRHTHAAELVREGVPMNVIRDQLGHTSLATTDRYLRNVAPADVISMGRARAWEG
jgi:site-specific recombinase XerD